MNWSDFFLKLINLYQKKHILYKLIQQIAKITMEKTFREACVEGSQYITILKYRPM